MGKHGIEEQPIILVGFMGVGKTTIGKMLAAELHWNFVDSDQLIEDETGMSIPDLFSQYGEAHFRELERTLIAKQCEENDKVVLSLGGGAFAQPSVREVCSQYGTSVYLELSWEAWLDRMQELIEGRPLLQTRSLEEIQELFQLRHSYYTQAKLAVLTDGLNQQQVTDAIIQQLSERV